MSIAPRLFPTTTSATKPPLIERQIALAGLPEPETEYPFAADHGRKWRLDYAWRAYRVGFEVDGAAFGRYLVITSGYERRGGVSIPFKAGTVLRVGGRHNTGPGMSADIEKHNAAQLLGWLLIRSTTTQIRDGYGIRVLRQALVSRGWKGQTR
jgi:hypothetical protein